MIAGPRRRAAAWAAVALLALAAIGGLLWHERATPYTVVSLTFDDGFATQWNARRLLDAHGYHGTFYINSARLGTARRLTAGQVSALAASGHEIAGHTLDHVDLPTVGRAARLREICRDRIALGRILGTAPTSFAYPYGASQPDVERDVAACGYNSARTVGGLRPESGTCDGCPFAERTTPADPLRIRSDTSFVATTPIEYAQAQIEGAQRTGGGWVPLVFHEVCDGCSKLAITPRHLDQLLDWMAARGVRVETVQQVVGGAAKPAVTELAAARLTGTASAALAGGSGADQGWPAIRWALLGGVAVLFLFPVGGLAVLRAAGRW